MSSESSLPSVVESAESETAELDFKASFDPSAAGHWCELIKDIVAIANSGGGTIVFGVNDDGTPAGGDLSAVLGIDPATTTDKTKKYTGHQFAGCSMTSGSRQGQPVAILSIASVSIPMVFTSPGTYDAGGGKQKTAFGVGTVYFRHGAKSEPGTSEDLRVALERELTRIRSSWLDGIAKLVTAPPGAKVGVLPDEVSLSGEAGAAAVRLVNDEGAPAFKAVRTDLLYPHRQKEVVKEVHKLLGKQVVTAHDVFSVRKVHAIDSQPNYSYSPQYSSRHYSQTFVEWMVDQYRADPDFFVKAREASKKDS